MRSGAAAASGVAFGAGVSATSRAATTAAGPPASGAPEFSAFIKFVQAYSFDELADRIADAGFDGIEATVRKGGYIEPPAAPDRLPALAEALAKRGLRITVATTDILRADQPHGEALLRTLASLGAPLYRMGFYRYDTQRPIVEQLVECHAAAKDVAAMNRGLGVRGVYQNHSGAKYVGAPVWDLPRLLEGIDPDELGVAFDIRHATIEGGLAWPLHYRVVRRWVRALYAKDFVWEGRKAQHAPLGEGRVDPKFYEQVAASGYDGPLSVHVEYLKKGGTEANMVALKTDLARLRELLA